MTTITINDEQRTLLVRVLRNEQAKARRLAERAKEDIEYCDLLGKRTGFAEMRQRRHEQAERASAELIALISASCHSG